MTTIFFPEKAGRAATSSAALNALLPTQAANNGKFLYTDGSNASWAKTLTFAQTKTVGVDAATIQVVS